MSNWERVLTVAALLLVGAVAFQSWFLLQMVRQNGRLLLRLDAIDARLAGVDVPADTTSAAPAPTTDKPGKPIGSVAPPFELKSLRGEYESLDSLLSAGRPAVLVFSSPTCGPCNALMPDIGRWQRDLGDRLTVAVVGQGEPAANRAKSAEHGISHVLLQERNEVSQLFDAKGTPSAVLIDKDGRIGSLVARGADEIRALIDDASVAAPVVAPVAQAVGAASTRAATNGSVDAQEVEVDEQAVIERSPAPPIELPDLDGNMVSLADFEGEPTVVLFWRPGCGFCRRMLPELKKWEETRPADAPRLLIVSSESIESNREQELASTTVLDEGFATGRAFGVSGTPSAVLVDEEGRIAGAPAVGSPRVLAMLSGEEFVPEPPAAPRVVLNVGDTAPAISLPDFDGNTVSLSDFPGEQRLVMFWSPGCVFCQRMVDDLKAFEADKPEGAPHLFIVSSGNLEANRAAGLQSTMVVGTDFATGTSYGATGTPSAVLVDADGLVASELMSGARKIYQALGHVTLGCRQCLDECRQQGAGEACRAVCEMSGQCP